MATFPVTWTSHASSPTPGRSSPSSVGSTCCAASPPMRPSRSGPACLMLLYAQPLSRILRLSAADLSRGDDGQTWLRLGDPPSPVPAPFGTLLHQPSAPRP